MTLFDIVVTALANAEVNGYAHNLDQLTDNELAGDLIDCDADVAKYDIDDVRRVVVQIRSERRDLK